MNITWLVLEFTVFELSNCILCLGHSCFETAGFNTRFSLNVELFLLFTVIYSMEQSRVATFYEQLELVLSANMLP